jgi:hypothetical protein
MFEKYSGKADITISMFDTRKENILKVLSETIARIGEVFRELFLQGRILKR